MASATLSQNLKKLKLPLAFGLLRLCTDESISRDDAVTIIHRALDAGIRLIDTADAYCLNHKDFHAGELLAKDAVNTWKGPRKEVIIFTKAGMTRPKGKWVPDGSPEHLRKTVDESLLALGVDRIDVLQLHVRDSRVPFEDTLAALAELQKQGKVHHLGLCNTTAAEIKQASRHFTVAVIQNELSVLARKSATDGTLAFAQEQGIPFLAYRPFGGIAKVEKLSTNKSLLPLAKKHHVTPQQLAIAAVEQAGDLVFPLIGTTQPNHLKQSVASLQIKLDSEDRSMLDAKFSFASANPAKSTASGSSGAAKKKAANGAEVVILMGIQGAGKSELVASYQKQGYERLNRDDVGGKLDDLVPRMVELLENGKTKIVLDNTYPTRMSREPIVSAAKEMGAKVLCRFLNTPIHEARINVVHRMLQRYGQNLGPDEMKAYAKTDNNLPPPAALKRWADSFEMPNEDEGFASVEVIPFTRRADAKQSKKGLLLDVDGTIRITKSGEKYPRHPDDVELIPGRREKLEHWIKQDYQLFFVSNQSGVASGKVEKEVVEAAFQKTIKLLGLPVVDVAYCPHPAFPVGCFCRKPFPGMGVYLMQKHQLAREHLVVVGDLKSDEDFAAGIGARFVHADEFFSN